MTGWTYLDTLPSDLILNEGVLALVSEADSGSVPTLQSAARERQVDLLGAIVPGLVIEDEFRRRGTLLVPLQSVPRVMVPVPEADHTPNETIEALADFVLEHAAEGGGDTLMLLVDATIADVASILARLYMEVGDQVNYAGVCVGSETFEQIELPADLLGDRRPFLQDGMTVTIEYYGDEALNVALPPKVVCKIIETEPVVKGQTAANSFKPAVLDNGLRIMVPPFIAQDEDIVVHTETFEYSERA